MRRAPSRRPFLVISVTDTDNNNESGSNRGIAYLWRDHQLLVVSGHQNRLHKHVPASVLWGLDGPIRVQIDDAWLSGSLVLVAPEVNQALDAQGDVLIVHLDPDTHYWRQLAGHVNEHGFAVLPPPDVADPRRLLRETNCSYATIWLSDFCKAMARPKPPLDGRVVQVTTELRTSLPDQLDLDPLAQMAGLSTSRLTHLFKQETGVSLKRFVLHLKIQRALRYYEPGMSLTQLATEAGFYDQPHMVRTARDMFDALPSEWIRDRAVKIVRCSGF